MANDDDKSQTAIRYGYGICKAFLNIPDCCLAFIIIMGKASNVWPMIFGDSSCWALLCSVPVRLLTLMIFILFRATGVTNSDCLLFTMLLVTPLSLLQTHLVLSFKAMKALRITLDNIFSLQNKTQR